MLFYKAQPYHFCNIFKIKGISVETEDGCLLR